MMFPPDFTGIRDGDKLFKGFEFGSFREALSFIVRLGMEAEALQHHPEIWNVYAKVEVRLCTHDAGNRVTERDVALAKVVEAFNWV